MEGIKFHHVRYIDRIDENEVIMSNGGHTIGWVIDESKDLLIVGLADCSLKDNYCKRTGRELVKSRIMSFMLGDNSQVGETVFAFPGDAVMQLVRDEIKSPYFIKNPKLSDLTNYAIYALLETGGFLNVRVLQARNYRKSGKQ